MGSSWYPGSSLETWERQGTRWQQRRPANSPPVRTGFAIACDPVRQRVVMFGGDDRWQLSTDETWEWDGHDWTQRAVSIRPPRRSDGAMAYDERRQRLVLFGGLDRGPGMLLADTWEWDGMIWVQRTPAVSPGMPVLQYGRALAYDAARQRIVLFGPGTWEYDGQIWLQRQPIVSPPLRQYHAMTYDERRQRVVMFGGDDFIGHAHDETWEWDGTGWSRRLPVHAPPPTGRPALAYDRDRGQTVLLTPGPYGVGVSDTWAWDGLDWSQRSSAPRAAISAGLVFDARRQRIVLFGGATLYNALAETWEWDGASWRELRFPTAPSPRAEHGMAFDGIQRTVLFGGHDGFSYFDDTWDYDGTRWQRVFWSTGPPARANHALVRDVVPGRILLFGGKNGTTRFDDTWVWDGRSWVQQTPATRPSARSHLAMVCDELRSRVVLFGGILGSLQTNMPSAETWEWDGATWSLIATATLPPPQGRHAMAFDRGRQRTLLFAGCRAVWAWDGVTWQSLADDPRLVLRTDCAAAHDPTWGRTLLYGGTSQLPSLPLRAPNPWWFGDLVPAAVQSVGTACGGPSGVPALIADEPYLGNLDFRIDLVGAAAGAPCLFGFALQTGASPLPGGCTLYLTAPWSVLPAVTAANGRAAVRGPVPAAPSLRGATLHAQAMALDPGAPLGVALTAGLRLVVGD